MKHILITGAASGIGEAIARSFADTGDVSLALLDKDEVRLSELASLLSTLVPVTAVVADLSTGEGVQAGMQKLALKHIDYLVSNAGVLVQGTFDALTLEQWRHSFAINFFAHVYVLRSALQLMTEGSSIVLLGSDQGLQPDETLGAYATAKAALHALTKVLARELGPRGIRVNCLAPGMTRTPLVEQLMEAYAVMGQTDPETAEYLELQRRGVPLARLAEPYEVALLARMLLEIPMLTGSILNASLGNVRAVMC